MKILLVQMGFIGDNILSTPVIAAISQIYPNAKISVLTTPISKVVYAGNSLVNEVICYDKRKTKKGLSGIWQMAKLLRQYNFDRCYSLHKSWRTACLLFLANIPIRIGFKNAKASFLYTHKQVRTSNLHDVERNLQILDHELALAECNKKILLPIPEYNKLSESVQKIITENKNYCVLVPGSVWKTKRWSTVGFREVAENLVSKNYPVLILGSVEEQVIAEQVASGLKVVNLVGKTTLPEMFYLVANSKLMVCNDSMSLHVASAFKIPTVAVFCATSPTFGFGPWDNPAALVVEKQGLYCKPCRRHGSNKCPTGTEACMRELPAENVIRAIDTVMTSTKA